MRLDPLLAIILLSSWAGAAEPVPPTADASAPVELVSLVYSGAAAGCPSEAQFVSEVTARVTRPVRFGADGAAVQMVVTLIPSGEQVTGKLEVARASSEPTHRDFTASSCEEVGSALALVAALALDPNARTDALPVKAESTEPVAAAPVAEAPPPPPPSKAPAPAKTPAPSTSSSPPMIPERYGYWVGASGSGTVGAAPKVLGLVGASVGMRVVREASFAPSVQLSALWGKTGVTGPANDTGEFTWATGRLELCPVSVSLSSPLRLDPCAAVEVGRLTARGADSSVTFPVTAARWWVAPGATLSLHATFEHWFVRAGGLLLFPATRDEFVFVAPNKSIHQAGPVVVGASLGLGFHFGE